MQTDQISNSNKKLSDDWLFVIPDICDIFEYYLQIKFSLLFVEYRVKHIICILIHINSNLQIQFIFVYLPKIIDRSEYISSICLVASCFYQKYLYQFELCTIWSKVTIIVVEILGFFFNLILLHNLCFFHNYL